MRPVRIVKTMVKRNPGPSSFNMIRSLRQMECNQDLVDQPDSGKWHDDAAETIDQEIAREHLASTDGFVLHTPERQRNQCNDDERVENHSCQHRALGRM